MDVEDLLAELSTLSHDRRVKRMVEIGKQARTDPELASVLASLERQGVYERRLALQACFGSLDGSSVLRAVADPSRSVRGLAITLIPLACDDRQAVEALRSLPNKTRRVLAARLLKAGRQAPVDSYLNALDDHDRDSLSALLSLGSIEVMTAHLQMAVEHLGPHEWRRFAKHYGRQTLELLQQRANEAVELDRRLLWLTNAIIPLTAERFAQETLALVQTLARHIPLSWMQLQPLVQWIPAEMADLALHNSDKLNLNFDGVGRKLDMDRIVGLIQHAYINGQDARFFGRLRPARRLELYRTFRQGWRDNDGVISHAIVALLPRELREDEGRRHLHLAALATRHAQRLPYISFLPWAEALAELDRYIRNPDPDLRVAGWSALIYSVRYQRQEFPELLKLIRARRNEQDPVRLVILSGLADLPPSGWQNEHLEALSQILQDTLDAADLSSATSGQVERLIVSLLPFHPQWAAAWLPTFVKERGRVYFYDLGTRLSDNDMRRLAPVLQPVIEAWQTREREMYLLAFAQSLHRRLRVFDGMVDVLVRVLQTTVTARTANATLALLLRHTPQRARDLIPDLIREDQSWITQPSVYSFLHRHRQDLLTPFLSPRGPYRGRFSTGKTRFILPLLGGFERWTPSQQTTFAQALRIVNSDEMRDMPAILFTIRRLEGLMFIEPSRLISLANVANKRQIIRDSALRALGRLDSREGIPVLLEGMGDDRARVAIYALRSALLQMPANRALEILRGVPMEKVTVAKEVIRLMGELRSDAAYGDLLKFNEQSLHRDVRVALLRALWDHLERRETWDILNRAAVDSDPAIATIVGRIPVDRLSSETQRRLVRLLVTLLAHPDSVVRIDVLRRCHDLPVLDVEHALMTPLLSAVASPFPDESQAAASAIFATYAGRSAEVLAQSVKDILSNRRALYTMLSALQSAIQGDRQHLLASARAVLAALEVDPLTATWRAEIAIQALPWYEVAESVIQMTSRQEFHADALASAQRTLQSVANSSVFSYGGRSFPDYTSLRSDAADVLQLETLLREHADSHVRRLALAALIAASQPPFGWNEERLSLLEIYRNDPAPLVAATAQFTFPPPV